MQIPPKELIKIVHGLELPVGEGELTVLSYYLDCCSTFNFSPLNPFQESNVKADSLPILCRQQNTALAQQLTSQVL